MCDFKFSGNLLKKKKKDTDEFTFNTVFYLSQYIEEVILAHVIDIKAINEVSF